MWMHVLNGLDLNLESRTDVDCLIFVKELLVGLQELNFNNPFASVLKIINKKKYSLVLIKKLIFLN